jgi:hypothetical protein
MRTIYEVTTNEADALQVSKWEFDFFELDVSPVQGGRISIPMDRESMLELQTAIKKVLGYDY